VASVDARRVAYIAEMLAAAGIEGQKALRRAAFLVGLARSRQALP
jgi:hypothetical protein